jgi:hypothetical protein
MTPSASGAEQSERSKRSESSERSERSESSGPRRPGRLAPSEDERAASARARGLSAPYIAGGRDPEPDAGLREERFYGRLLIVMVAVIVAGGFILGIIANVIGILGSA